MIIVWIQHDKSNLNSKVDHFQLFSCLIPDGSLFSPLMLRLRSAQATIHNPQSTLTAHHSCFDSAQHKPHSPLTAHCSCFDSAQHKPHVLLTAHRSLHLK